MARMELEDDEDAGFLAHAKATFDRRFIKIATPIHWVALFLHPSCCKLSLSGNHRDGLGKSLDFMIKTALGIAKQWQWGSDKAKKLAEDLKAYNQFKSPFTGIKTLATVLHSIAPHSADVEHLFSELGGIQSPQRNGWLVDTMEKVGRVRGHLSYRLFEKKKKEGKPTQRKHAHMHTQPALGIDSDLAKDLENPITWIPPLSGADDDDDPTEDLVQKAYNELKKRVADEGDSDETESEGLGSVVGGEMVDFNELDKVERGQTDAPATEVIDVVGNDTQGTWDIDDFM
ncbi:hypothetical protein B0H10DRAFT_2230324 [Mycena sp. CBHHK59/15]|nr:hypothetical protein B0H10DRAFT_2230324 [Mycena sp. CBHHK59/15]